MALANGGLFVVIKFIINKIMLEKPVYVIKATNKINIIRSSWPNGEVIMNENLQIINKLLTIGN
jgi:hypothetical protein